MRHLILTVVMLMHCTSVFAQNAPLRLALPDDPELFQLMKFMMPRFTLKHRVRVELVGAENKFDLALTPSQDTETPAYLEHSDGRSWAIVENIPSDDLTKITDWLASEVGHNTMNSFKIDDASIFSPVTPKEVEVVVAPPSGDMVVGEKLALQHCGRCHVISDKNRFGGIGSTPSFGALRTLPGWQDRFDAFFTLNPHPSFTQVEGVTEPFPIERPSHIAPIYLSVEDVEAIAAYASSIQPKDLGRRINSN